MSRRSSETRMDDKVREALSGQIAKTIAVEIGNKYADYNCTKRSNKLKIESHRNGPIPIEECLLTKTAQAATYGTLDSDCEELDFEDIRIKNANSTAYNKIRVTLNERGDSIASCRAMIVYFSKLAKAKDEEENVDLNFVEHLFDSGADINFPDKHGQTVLHEVARGWHPDVAKFMLEQGAEINKADAYGRTALHLAAAVDYGEMVEFLIENGADLGRETIGERQTAMHYASKNNATQSLKVMLRLGGRINDRDYKRRTPLFVAAETARAESARFLVEQGAPCGVYDSSGTPLLSLLIEKMPQIAMEAIEQFHFLDRAFRKHYYYLGSLEMDPVFLKEKIPESRKDRKEQKARSKAEKKLIRDEIGDEKISTPKCYARTPLEVVVQYEQMDLIMHPVFQRLLHVKWNLFGRSGSIKLLVLNLFYTLIWTILGLIMPREPRYTFKNSTFSNITHSIPGRDYYIPVNESWGRLILEPIGVCLTGYFIFREITQVRSGEKRHNFWRHWRVQDLEKDLKYCHPRWPEEEKYLRSELDSIRSYQRTYFRDPWNIYEWITYVVICVLIFTRILAVVSDDASVQSIHPRVYAIGLIVIWLRFMRCCRAFRTLGPFIAILGSVINDTLKFAFLFFEFFVPYTVGFWILFGGRGKAVDWNQFHDLVFSIWTMTLMGNFDWDGLVASDRLMAQILCGTYFALAGVVCMNLYIALLSDTFARVYSYAQANAVMQQAKTIIMLEGSLNKYHRSKFGHYMQEKCSPQEVYTREDTSSTDDRDNDMLERVARQITNRIDELEETLRRRRKPSTDFQIMSPARRQSVRQSINTDDVNSSTSMTNNFIEDQHTHNQQINSDFAALQNGMREIRALLLNTNNGNNNSSNNNNNSGNSNNNNSNNNTNRRSQRNSVQRNTTKRKSTILEEDEFKSQTLPRTDASGNLVYDDGGLSSRRHTHPSPTFRPITPQYQEVLQEMAGTETTNDDGGIKDSNTNSLYPTLPPGNVEYTSGTNSGRSTPSKRRRRRRKSTSSVKSKDEIEEPFSMAPVAEYDALSTESELQYSEFPSLRDPLL